MKEHAWINPSPGLMAPFCKVCGIVQRRDGKNKPCKGAQKLRPLGRAALEAWKRSPTPETEE